MLSHKGVHPSQMRLEWVFPHGKLLVIVELTLDCSLILVNWVLVRWLDLRFTHSVHSVNLAFHNLPHSSVIGCIVTDWAHAEKQLSNEGMLGTRRL